MLSVGLGKRVASSAELITRKVRGDGDSTMKEKGQNVGIFAFPISEISNAPADAKAGNMPFSNLVDILRHLFDNLYVITGNEERVLFKKNDKMHVSVVPHRGGTGFITRIIK